METNQMLVAEENSKRRYNNSDSQELYEFMKGKSGERVLGMYGLKGNRTALRGKEGVTLRFTRIKDNKWRV